MINHAKNNCAFKEYSPDLTFLDILTNDRLINNMKTIAL
jgi:hypothetical protein